MATRRTTSGKSGILKYEIEITDKSDEVSAAIHEAVRVSLERCGLLIEAYAKDLVHVVTGRLRNSITHEVGDKEVTIGSDVSYAGFEEEGTSKRQPHPFLRPALEEHKAEYIKIIEEEINSAIS